jgi:hypothetical protein
VPQVRLAALVAVVACVFFACAGCGDPASSQLRSSTPAEAAAKVMELHDANKDGKLSADELEASPALVDGMPRIDSNRDGAIAQGEIQARFEAHGNLSDIIAVQCQVTKGGAPLVGAEVTLTPEPFMGDGLQSYAGTSAEGGEVAIAGVDVPMPGVPTGYYKVHIVQQAEGVDAMLGCEVADDTPSANRLAFDVKASTARGG